MPAYVPARDCDSCESTTPGCVVRSWPVLERNVASRPWISSRVEDSKVGSTRKEPTKASTAAEGSRPSRCASCVATSGNYGALSTTCSLEPAVDAGGDDEGCGAGPEEAGGRPPGAGSTAAGRGAWSSSGRRPCGSGGWSAGSSRGRRVPPSWCTTAAAGTHHTSCSRRRRCARHQSASSQKRKNSLVEAADAARSPPAARASPRRRPSRR